MLEITIGSQGSWRVQNGAEGTKVGWDAVSYQISEAIQNQLLQNSIKMVADYSPKWMEDTVRMVQRAANMEAVRIFTVALTIMEKSLGANALLNIREGPEGKGIPAFNDMSLSPLRLQANTKKAFGGAAFEPKSVRGQIYWRPLSRRWLKYKHSKYPQNRDKFFMAKGKSNGLYSQMKRYKSFWIESKFGGIQVESDYAGYKGDRALRRKDVSTKTVLGDITIRIFPRIQPSLLPGLATRRWTDHYTDGAFEKKAVGGQSAKKLAGNRIHRPLLQPITQFFILHRLPLAINNAITKRLSNFQIGTE